MTALVTGATGFVGAAIVRNILAAGEQVRVLSRPRSDRSNLEGLRVEVVYGDLQDPTSLQAAIKGCRRLYHTAAHYSLWDDDPAFFHRVNVEGTRQILRIAADAGVERMVYTSTVGALGIRPDRQPADETTPVSIDDMVGAYKRTKFLAELAAVQLAKEGLPIVIVNPSAPVGPRDIKPTPTGQMILDFIEGRMWAYLDTGMNLVDVDDVAEGHRLAMEKGRIGEKYILGNRNLHLQEIFELLGGISGIRPPRFKAPYPLALSVAYLNEWVADWITRRPPRVPLTGVKMAKKYMFFSPAKAVRELGLPQTPIEEALEKAVRWFRNR